MDRRPAGGSRSLSRSPEVPRTQSLRRRARENGEECALLSAFYPGSIGRRRGWISSLGGLRAVHLPGHTAGHTGYFCESRRLLFCGDLFASYGQLSHRPPAVFNEDSAAGLRNPVSSVGAARGIPTRANQGKDRSRLLNQRFETKTLVIFGRGLPLKFSSKCIPACQN